MEKKLENNGELFKCERCFIECEKFNSKLCLRCNEEIKVRQQPPITICKMTPKTLFEELDPSKNINLKNQFSNSFPKKPNPKNFK